MLWGLMWYWWVLIVLGVVAIGYLKVKVGKRMLEKRKEKMKMAEDKEDF